MSDSVGIDHFPRIQNPLATFYRSRQSGPLKTIGKEPTWLTPTNCSFRLENRKDTSNCQPNTLNFRRNQVRMFHIKIRTIIKLKKTYVAAVSVRRDWLRRQTGSRQTTRVSGPSSFGYGAAFFRGNQKSKGWKKQQQNKSGWKDKRKKSKRARRAASNQNICGGKHTIYIIFKIKNTFSIYTHTQSLRINMKCFKCTMPRLDGTRKKKKRYRSENQGGPQTLTISNR